jgi:hypothetical protein
MADNDYKKLIEQIEKKRNILLKIYKSSMFSKKIIKKYLNKYDELLLNMYTKYELNLENKM